MLINKSNIYVLIVEYLTVSHYFTIYKIFVYQRTFGNPKLNVKLSEAISPNRRKELELLNLEGSSKERGQVKIEC